MSPLADPDPNLRACVVVPAKNEEDLIGRCLRALADQEFVSPEEYEVVLVLDDCTDATETRAREVARSNPDLRLHLLDGPAEGAGHARRLGMNTACSRLLSLNRERGLIASTDADTVVAPDWLSAQFGCIDGGAVAIGGRIELEDEGGLPGGVACWRSERGHRRHMDLLSESLSNTGGPHHLEHWQFSGASLSLTAEVYREVGGLEPRAALEDEHLERILRQRAIPIERPLSVRVMTSARLVGRAERGLARDLALASWFRTNTYKANTSDPEKLSASKKYPVSVVVVADEDTQELRDTAEALLTHEDSGLLDEMLVVCSGPLISGLPPEIIVLQAQELMPGFGPVRGYGDVLWRSLRAAKGEILIFLEPGVGISAVPTLLSPLLEREELSLVKGFHDSPGELSELVARPLINLHNPELSGFMEPLSKNLAARRNLLESLPFPVGEGITLSLLLDAAEHVGVEALAQAELGKDDHYISASDSPGSAYAIQAVAASRAVDRDPVPGPLFMPSSKGLQTRRIPLEERPSLVSLDSPASISRVVG